jgi:hypothetical protein
MTAVVTAAPCAKCPFRRDVPIYLRLGRRREIARHLIDGGSFACHATVDYDPDEEGEGLDDDYDDSGASMCAGAAKAMLADDATTNAMRVAERLGVVDLDRVAERGADVWGLAEWQTLAEGATADNPEEADDDDEIETCNTVNERCIAPAGYGGYGGGIAYGTDPADLKCSECWEPVCSACADEEGRCGLCTDEEDDDGS